MNNPFLIGIAAALFAAFAWSLNFIVPFVIGDYSIFDFAVFRFVVSGAIGLAFLAYHRKILRTLKPVDWIVAFGLGFGGYLGYFLAVIGAAIFAGPVIAPAFLGLVPVVLAIAGNLGQRTIAWHRLALPFALTAAGLALVNISALDPASMGTVRSLWIGIPLAILAVALWTWFGLANQAALARRPNIDAGAWTALIMLGAGVEMLAFLPVGLQLGVFEIPHLGLGWPAAAPIYIWGISLAVLASVGGAMAWTMAAQRLPVALSAQLIVSETVFGTIFGLAAHGRWPTLAETAGMSVLTVGIIMSIRAFHSHGKSVAVA
jgi:drug/metabolite transporter (DMT)-like permease